MFRRSRISRVINSYGPSRILSIKHQSTLSDSLLLLDWPLSVGELQKEFTCNFLQVHGAPVSVVKPVITPQQGSRLATCCVVTVAKNDVEPKISRWIPFIVDTGAPRALYMSAITWSYFNLEVKPRKSNSDPLFAHNVRIGKWAGEAFLSEEHGETDAHLRDVNVIGMELLGSRDVAQSVTEILQTALEKPSLDEVWVTDGKASFLVTPAKQIVAHLKEAIKAKLDANGLGPVNGLAIIIKTPDGAVMGDEDSLNTNVKYVFSVPTK